MMKQRHKVDGSIRESSDSMHPPETASRMAPIENRVTQSSLWNKRGILFQMTRPSTIPGILLFQLLGIFLTLRDAGQSHLFGSFLLSHPIVWITLVSVYSVSATSMVVNDYYDAKLGRDTLDRKDEKVLLDRENGVSLSLVKELLMYLYAAALLFVSFLPGIPTRLAVTIALIITFLYTKHLKPRTWIKNIACASVIAFAPWTAGSSVMHLLHPTTTEWTVQIFLVPSLWRLSAILFTGILGREILMDCNDVQADRAAGIRTVPVVYGRHYASKIATICAIIMWCIAATPPFLELLMTPSTCATTMVSWRRLVLATIGGFVQVKGSWNVWKSQGMDPVSVNKAVNGSIWAAVLVFASFL